MGGAKTISPGPQLAFEGRSAASVALVKSNQLQGQLGDAWENTGNLLAQLEAQLKESRALFATLETNDAHDDKLGDEAGVPPTPTLTPMSAKTVRRPSSGCLSSTQNILVLQDRASTPDSELAGVPCTGRRSRGVSAVRRPSVEGKLLEAKEFTFGGAPARSGSKEGAPTVVNDRVSPRPLTPSRAGSRENTMPPPSSAVSPLRGSTPTRHSDRSRRASMDCGMMPSSWHAASPAVTLLSITATHVMSSGPIMQPHPPTQGMPSSSACRPHMPSMRPSTATPLRTRRMSDLGDTALAVAAYGSIGGGMMPAAGSASSGVSSKTAAGGVGILSSPPPSSPSAFVVAMMSKPDPRPGHSRPTSRRTSFAGGADPSAPGAAGSTSDILSRVSMTGGDTASRTSPQSPALLARQSSINHALPPWLSSSQQGVDAAAAPGQLPTLPPAPEALSASKPMLEKAISRNRRASVASYC